MKRTVKRLVNTGLGLFLFTFLLVPISISGKRAARFVSETPPLGSARCATGALADARATDTLLPGPEAWSTSAQSKQKPSATEDLYRTNCARCHGADGRGDTPLGQTYNSPNLTDNEWWQKHSDISSTKSLVSIVTNGKGGMPAFRKKLKSAEIKALVNYVRKFRKAK
jgi:mono/diheme cytochrome c family protein